MNVSNMRLASYADNWGNSATLNKLANAFTVSVTSGLLKESFVYSFSDRKRAEIEYAYHVHYFTRED